MSKKLKLLAMVLTGILLSINHLWADATCTLSNANIVAGSVVTSYGSTSFTDGCSKTWNAYCIKTKHSNATSSYHYIQIKAYASSTAYYLQVPTMPGTIKSITMVVSASGKPRTDGGNSATLYFSSSNNSTTAASGLSANPKTAASGTGASSVTIDCESLGLTSGYITASGAVRIWGDVVVTYSTGSTYTLHFLTHKSACSFFESI